MKVLVLNLWVVFVTKLFNNAVSEFWCKESSVANPGGKGAIPPRPRKNKS